LLLQATPFSSLSGLGESPTGFNIRFALFAKAPSEGGCFRLTLVEDRKKAGYMNRMELWNLQYYLEASGLHSLPV
jgi:hypothetical protein